MTHVYKENFIFNQNFIKFFYKISSFLSIINVNYIVIKRTGVV